MPSNLAISELNTEFVFPEDYLKGKQSKPLLTDMEKLFEIIKKTNRLPLNNGDVFYSDDKWDFSLFNDLAISKKNLIISFKKTPEVFKDELKCYVITKLLENKNKIQSIKKSAQLIDQFLRYANEHGYCYLEDVPSNLLENFLKNYKEPKLSNMKTAIKTLYEYYAVAKKDIATADIIEAYTRKNGRILKAIKKSNKIQSIPSDYFNKLIFGLIQVSKDETLDNGIRGAACIELIMSQTGLRIGECLFAKTDCIKEVKIFNGETSYYMVYGTWKRIAGNNQYVEEKTYVNKITKEAVDNLIELFKEERQELNVDYLYLGDKDTDKTELPLTAETYNFPRNLLYAHLNKYIPVVNIETKDLPKGINNHEVKNSRRTSKIRELYPEAKTLAYPSAHQFRVNVCTELYKKGVPLKYIEKFMGHLSSSMTGYYVRITPKNPQEDMEFSIEMLKKIVQGEIKPLGGTPGLVDKINNFIKDGNYNVNTDLNEICEKLAKKIPIRQKTGGVCIKASMMRDCSKDALTNEFYCAYDVCPNIYHFFYMADVSYRQCQELLETISINKENGFVRQVEKEQGMLNTIVTNKLIPQLDELKNMIDKKGVQYIYTEYPDLKEIVENYNKIYKEAESWKTI